MATIISIGRGVPEMPDAVLAQPEWDAFRGSILAMARAYGEDIYFYGEGQGIYEGKGESSFTVVFGDVEDPWLRAKLEGRLSRLAEEYAQDSIAVTYGETFFIGPEGR